MVDVFISLLGITQGVGAIALGAYAVPPQPEPEDDKSASGVQIQPVIGLGTAGVIGTF